MTEIGPAPRIAPLRALRLLLGLRVRRGANTVIAGLPMPAAKGRAGTGHRNRESVAPLISIVALAWISTSLFGLVVRAAELQPDVSRPATVGVVVLLASAIVLFGLLGGNTGNLAEPDPELESLSVYPVSLTTLRFADWVWSTFFTGYAWAMLFPALAVLAVFGGNGAWSLLGAAVLVPPITALVLLVREILMRLAQRYLSASWIGGLQTGATVGAAMAGMLCAGAAMGHPRLASGLAAVSGDAATIQAYGSLAAAPFWALVQALDGVIQWTPWGAAALVSYLPTTEIAPHAATLVIGVTTLLAVGWVVMSRLLRSGPLLVSGARERSVSTFVRAWPQGPLTWELMLTARNGERLASVLMPLVVILALVWMPSEGTPQMMRQTFAFGIGWTGLMLGTHQARHHQRTIWLQYMLPHAVIGVFRRTALVLFGIATVHAMIVVVYLNLGEHVEVLPLLRSVSCMLLGLYFVAHIGVAHDALSTDLNSESATRSMPITHTMLLVASSGVVYVALSVPLREQVGIMVLMGAFTLGLWQRLMRYEPYLLDPTVGPPNDLTLADGAVIALFHVITLVLVDAIIEIFWGVWWPCTSSHLGSSRSDCSLLARCISGAARSRTSARCSASCDHPRERFAPR